MLKSIRNRFLNQLISWKLRAPQALKILETYDWYYRAPNETGISPIESIIHKFYATMKVKLLSSIKHIFL